MLHWIFRILVILSVVVVWTEVFMSRILPYDDNVAAFLFACVCSVFTTVVVLLIAWLRKDWYRTSRSWFNMFLLLASPLTLFIFFWVMTAIHVIWLRST